MAASITVYTFEDTDGNEEGFETQDFQEAVAYAQENKVKIVANEYEWSEAYPVEGYDFTESSEEEQEEEEVDNPSENPDGQYDDDNGED